MTNNQNSENGIQYVRGFPFPDVPWFKRKTLEDILDYMPHDGDIIVGSYMKTGSTWLKYIILQILSNGESFPSFNEIINKIAPFMEMSDVSVLNCLKEPRFYNHHVAYNMMQKNEKSKVFCIYRKPEDVFVSYYHFMRSLEAMPPLSFEEYFERFLTGDIPYGSYPKHVLSYLEHKHDDNLLLVSYEQLKLNTKEEILRIAQFLGEKYHKNISENEDILEKIVKNTSFDYMKKNVVLIHPAQYEGKSTSESAKKVNFFRKGIIGDGKQALTVQQLERLKKVSGEILKEHDEIKYWLD